LSENGETKKWLQLLMVPLSPQVMAHMAIVVLQQKFSEFSSQEIDQGWQAIVRNAHIVVGEVTQLMKESYSMYEVYEIRRS